MKMNEKGCVSTPKKLLIIKKWSFNYCYQMKLDQKKCSNKISEHLIIFLKY
jgi:hypothetical protein